MTPHIPQFVLDMAEKRRKEYFRLQEKVEKARQVQIDIAKERAKDNVEEWQDGC